MKKTFLIIFILFVCFGSLSGCGLLDNQPSPTTNQEVISDTNMVTTEAATFRESVLTDSEEDADNDNDNGAGDVPLDEIGYEINEAMDSMLQSFAPVLIDEIYSIIEYPYDERNYEGNENNSENSTDIDSSSEWQ